MESKPICPKHNLPIQVISLSPQNKAPLLCIKCTFEPENRGTEPVLFLDDLKDYDLERAINFLNIYGINKELKNALKQSSAEFTLNSEIRSAIDKIDIMMKDISSEFVAKQEENRLPDQFFEEAENVLQIKEIKDLVNVETNSELLAKVLSLNIIHNKTNILKGLEDIHKKYNEQIEALSKGTMFLHKISSIVEDIKTKLAPFADNKVNVKFVNSKGDAIENGKIFISTKEKSFAFFNFKIQDNLVNSVHFTLRLNLLKLGRISFIFKRVSSLANLGHLAEKENESRFEILRLENVSVAKQICNVWVVRTIIQNDFTLVEATKQSQFKLNLNNANNLFGITDHNQEGQGNQSSRPEPTGGIMGSQPTSSTGGLMGSQPVGGLMGPEPTSSTGGLMGSQPVGGIMGSQPTRGIMGSQPTRGIMGSQPTGGIMGSQPTGGIMGSQPTRGIMGSQPTRGIMGSQPTSSTGGIMGSQPTSSTGGMFINEESSKGNRFETSENKNTQPDLSNTESKNQTETNKSINGLFSSKFTKDQANNPSTGLFSQIPAEFSNSDIPKEKPTNLLNAENSLKSNSVTTSSIQAQKPNFDDPIISTEAELIHNLKSLKSNNFTVYGKKVTTLSSEFEFKYNPLKGTVSISLENTLLFSCILPKKVCFDLLLLLSDPMSSAAITS